MVVIDREDQRIIVALAHHARKPGYWQGRIRRERGPESYRLGRFLESPRVDVPSSTGDAGDVTRWWTRASF
jgi:hypothetical protein